MKSQPNKPNPEKLNNKPASEENTMINNQRLLQPRMQEGSSKKQAEHIPNQGTEKTTSVYISSSMFRYMDTRRLSSGKSGCSKVFLPWCKCHADAKQAEK